MPVSGKNQLTIHTKFCSVHDWSKVRSVISMLFTYSDMIGEYGSAYRIGKAVDSGEVFEVARVMLGDCCDCVEVDSSTDESD